MRALRIAFWAVGGTALAVVLVLAALLAYEPRYDVNDPDYARFAPILAELGAGLRVRGLSGKDAIDLTDLNDGDWTTACVFGGYTYPSREMASRGAVVSDEDQVRLSAARSEGFRLAEVEEVEMLIAYVGGDNIAHFVHFQTGIGPDGQGLRKCVAKPDTRIILDGYP